MKPADFDEVFFAVDNVPFFRLAVAVDNVACFEVAFGVPGFGVGVWGFEVFGDDGGAADAEFAAGVGGCDVVAVVVD